MDTPVNNPSTVLNWVDYCDSLGDEYFRLVALAQNPGAVARSEPVSLAVALQEAAREVS